MAAGKKEEVHANKNSKTQLEVCLAVEAGYWFGDANLQGTARAINKLYKKLFPASSDGRLAKRTAQSVWSSIVDNPKSPEGPLTLSAISYAILSCADFSEPEDQSIFLKFFQNNEFFKIIFSFFIFENELDVDDEIVDEKFNGLFELAFSKPVKSYDIFPALNVAVGKIPLIPFKASPSLPLYGSVDEIERLKNIWMKLGEKGLREKFSGAMKKDEIFSFECQRILTNASLSLEQHLQKKIEYLIGEYSKTGTDSGKQLYYMLNNDRVREKCKLTPGQVKNILERNVGRPGEEPYFNTRLEAIIAADDNLYNLIEKPEKSEETIFQLYHPWLWARFKIDDAIKEHANLNGYLNKLSKSNPLTIQEAFFIASKPQFWIQIDPYSLNPVTAFINRLIPSFYAGFFKEEKNKLAEINPIFGLRIDWELSRNETLMTFEEWLIQSKQSGLDELVADIADAGSLISRSTFEKGITAFGKALLNNPCRFDAFIEEIDTPEKASAHEQFILSDGAVKMITTQQLTRLMLVSVNGPTKATCITLAQKIILKRPQLLVEIISNAELRKNFSKAPDAIIQQVVEIIRYQKSFLSTFLDCLTVIIGQYTQVQLDEDLIKMLKDYLLSHDLSLYECNKIHSLSPATIEFIQAHEKFKDKIPAEFTSSEKHQADQSEDQGLALAKLLLGPGLVHIPQSLQFIDGMTRQGVAVEGLAPSVVEGFTRPEDKVKCKC